jgi:hypothetical protein
MVSQFEFLSVLVSIVFGLGLAHLSEGVFKLAYQRKLNEIDLLLAGFTFMVLVLNWWIFFAYHTHDVWTFEQFLILVLWALSFYGLAVALFPPHSAEGAVPGKRHRWFAGALLITLILDITQTALLGKLFTPWYFLPFTGQYAVCCMVLMKTNNLRMKRMISLWLFLSIALWSLIVRRYLAG